MGVGGGRGGKDGRLQPHPVGCHPFRTVSVISAWIMRFV